MIYQNLQMLGLKPLIKLGLGLILIGLLILILKELIILILASIFIIIGTLILSFAYKIWRSSRY